MDYFNHYGDLPEMPDMKNLTPEEQERVCLSTAIFGCATYAAAMVVVLILCLLFSGCGAHRVVEQHHHHHYEADTLAVQAAVDAHMQSWHQQMDSAFSERFNLFSTELYHSSHETEVTTETVTTATDSLGRTVRNEQRIISRDISFEQRQLWQRLAREYESRLRVAVDSAIYMLHSEINALQAHSEQTGSTSQTETPAADSRPWYRRLFDRFHYFINGFLIAAVLWLTRRWWLRPLKKHLHQ